MEFLSAVTDDKFHQVISAKGNASKLVTILSNNSGRLVKVRDAKIAFLFQVERRLTETSIQPQLLGVYDTNNDGVLRKDDLCKVLKSLMIKNSMDFDVDFPFCSIVFF